MDNDFCEYDDAISFAASEFALGRQRCRKWVSLITQQLRLRHVYQIFAYNIQTDKKPSLYFTLHNTPMSSPFYTSEKVNSKHPKWNEIVYDGFGDTNVSSVVIRIWRSTDKEDEILLTWGVNFSGLVYLGNKIADLQPKYFKANTVIFFMQGVYFTSQAYLRDDLDTPLPFRNNLNLIEVGNKNQFVYRRVAVKVSKTEVTNSYNLDKLRKLQELQRHIKNKKIEVEYIKEQIKKATECETRQEPYDSGCSSTYDSNIRFAPQLLTMNSLNKMLHEKPTKAERVAMSKIGKEIEVYKFKIRMLIQVRDKACANLKRLKEERAKLANKNEVRNCTLMSSLHVLHKESQYWNEYKANLLQNKEYLWLINERLRLRQSELLKELLFIYPIDKIANENKYTMLGIHLPDSEQLIDYQNPGVSVVLGYICHILIMCSIFLQVPLRHPMRHFGSRSVIYSQVLPDIPDKEREFPLYTKGKDKAHFNYAVFLLNKNICQLRWYFHRKLTIDLKETLKHLRIFLLGDDFPNHRSIQGHSSYNMELTSEQSTSERDPGSLEKLVSPSSLSSISSTNFNDPLLERLHEDMRREKQASESGIRSSPKKKLGFFKSSSKRNKKEKMLKSSSEVLAVPEAYLNKQISKDLFHKCASGEYKFSEKDITTEGNIIQIREGVEEYQANLDTSSKYSDSIEEGTDPLDPASNFDAIITKSIDISGEHAQTDRKSRLSKSVDSYVDEESTISAYKSTELGSDPTILNSCDKVDDFKNSPGARQQLFEQFYTGDVAKLSTNDVAFPEECLRLSFQAISSPLKERTDRLLSGNQSFNLVKHRPAE